MNDYHEEQMRERQASIDMERAKKALIKKCIFGGICATIIIICLCFVSSFYFQTVAGYSYHYQNTFTGNEEIYTSPGVHFKLPIFSKVTTYKQVLTLDYDPLAGKDSTSTLYSGAIKVLFADTYTADISGTLRFRLPIDLEKFKILHREFRSFDNLVRSLIEKTAQDVIINTATQYTGEEFFLGAINQFKASVTDQLKNGIYKTNRMQVEVSETSLAPVGLGQEDSNKLEMTKKLVWKTVPMMDGDENYIRQENPLELYGIEATQFTMGRPIPEKQLAALLTDKKKLVAERIRTVQQQSTATEQAKTAQLLEDIERTKAKQKALKAKELAVIALQQEVEVAQKQADKEKVEFNKEKDLAVIQKQKELAISKANKAIQKANSLAAKYEAVAIEAKGLAEATVIKATYNAYDKTIYTQEMNRDISLALYNNLSNFKVDMPTNMIITDDSKAGLTSNLDVLTNFAVMEAMKNKKIMATATQ